MKTIFATFLVFILHLTSNAQDSFKKLPQAANISCPILLVDEHIIAHTNVITSKEDIEDIAVIKEKPSRKAHFYNLTANGILFAKLKKKIPSKTQAELNTFFNLKENNPVYVNGYLLEQDTYTIATESIATIDLIAPNEETDLDQKVINVWILSQEERKNGCSLQQME
ncbi:hypothetical protein [Maribacter sp. 1_2014MBL_MicDiv]|uniref:hypothetical protein n=1 Tax=Maribacter sp. 1_2014MBL_MicDiv TaxID=1644130 RepID=UPI0008F4D379|nr:hypothetical protein [Maribacter sp. 1_2014MBL_MicDiv]APA63787.1 hypothetical protein YQ22_05385 [Maribacter sp. 1_2014MBL_MicDiv]